MEISDIEVALCNIIEERAEGDDVHGVWGKGGAFDRIMELQTDNRGEVGEAFVAATLRALGHDVEQNNETDPTRKHWDIRVDGKVKLEVKTATIGKGGKNFQHENFEKDRDYDAVVLLDIAPNDLHLTVAEKNRMPFTSKNSHYTVNPRKMHRRRHGIAYKRDLILRDVESRKVETLADIEAMFKPLLESGK